jgi:four helix bundle protein
MNYAEWEKTVSEAITDDSFWKMSAYRLALFLSDVCWHDVCRLGADHRTRALSDQLYRAVGSIGANLAEGYSRGTGRDRAHFYEYSLGSARESRDWYFKSRHVLGETIVDHRLKLLAEVIRILLTMIPQQRGRALRDESVIYETISHDATDIHLEALLNDVPLSEL